MRARNSGLTLEAAGRFAEARTAFERRWPRARRLAIAAARCPHWPDSRGSIADAGALDAAQTRAMRALDLVEQLRVGLLSTRARLTLGVTAQGVYELARDILIDRHLQAPAAGYDQAALAVQERARARSLLEALTNGGTAVPAGDDASLALVARQRDLEADLEVKTARLGRLVDAGQPAQAVAAARAELSALVLSLDEVKADIRKRSPAYAALTQLAPPPLPDRRGLAVAPRSRHGALRNRARRNPQRRLADDVEGPSHGDAAAAGADRAAAHALVASMTARNQFPDGESRAARQARIAAADRQWARGGLAARLARARALRRRRRPPRRVRRRWRAGGRAVRGAAGHGARGHAGFRARVWAGRGVVRARRTRRRDRAAVSVDSRRTAASHQRSGERRRRCAHWSSPIPSSAPTILARVTARRADRGSARREVAAASVAAMRARVNRRRAMTRASATRGACSRCTRCRDCRFRARRRETIASLAGRDRVVLGLDFEAARAQLTKPRVAAPDVLHIATHALIDETQPELSGIVLSLVDAQGQPMRGFLPLVEVYDLPVHAQLVVLSACRTAAGPDVPGEGLASLTRGFMYAGSPRVVASLWSVEDRATAVFMRAFYEALFVRGQPAPAALRTAQAELRRSPRWSSPYYWAAFTFHGDWR